MQLTHKMAQEMGHDFLAEASRLEELGNALIQVSGTGQDHIVYHGEHSTEFHAISLSDGFEYDPNFDYLITDEDSLEYVFQAPPDPQAWAA